MQDNIDAAHVLRVERAKVVARAVSEAGVDVHVLDDVADPLHAVGAAPVAHGAAEVVAVERRDGVHVGELDKMRAVAFVPEFAEVRRGVFAQCGRHSFQDYGAEREGQPLLSHAEPVFARVDEMRADQFVAELRLVGEEPRYHVAEILGVAPPVRLVNGVEEETARGGVEEVDAVRADALMRLPHEEDAPAAVWHVPREDAVAHIAREIDRGPFQQLPRSLGAALGEDAKQRLAAVGALAHQERRFRRRSHDIDVALGKA